MKKIIFLLVSLLIFTGYFLKVQPLSGKEYADRWFYASFGCGSDADCGEMCALLKTAGENGLNGMLWAAGLEGYAHWDAPRKERLVKIRQAADAAGVEIIPILWSVGYGTGLSRDNNLVEGGPVKDVPFTVRGNQAVFSPEETENPVKNPGFEVFGENRFAEYDFNDKPGVISFSDTEVKHSGSASIRMENFAADKYGHGRITQQVDVRPNRRYVLSVWYKTDGLEMDGKFRFQIHRKDANDIITSVAPLLLETRDRKPGKMSWRSCDAYSGKSFYYREVLSTETDDGWKQAKIYFKTGPEDTQIRLYLGIWGGTEKGKFWLDDVCLQQAGMREPLNRPGTPMTVKNALNGTIYEEGKDFTRPDFKLALWKAPVENLSLGIPAGSRIPDGTPLFVSYYEPYRTIQGQVSVCMSEPALYDFFEESARGVMEALAPKKWFLSMDEIRAAGSCEACKKRGLSLAQILGDCITKQYEIIERVQPGAKVYIWSDMLDPLHNCHANYYACDGDFSGVCDFIPKEIIISCWYYKIREESMKYFSEKGFQTQAAAYYDKDEDPNWNGWLETCARTPGCTGIMYTTWQKKYDLLVPFAQALK